jgi:UMF1 family MFS transporter
MYDFANSGYTTVVLTTVFSAYFVGVVAAQATWATLALSAALSLSYLLAMFTLPALGARADARAGKRRLLFCSTLVCVACTAMLATAGPGEVLWGLLLLALSNYAYCIGESVIAAFLPELATARALGRVSGWGWGFGYFGGMLALGLSLAWVNHASSSGQSAQAYVPQVMLLTAAVFAVAAVPSFIFLRERARARAGHTGSAMAQLRFAWANVRPSFPDFRHLLLCGTLYHAGISVVITLSSVYATQAMGFSMSQTMLLVFTVNIAAAVGALAFGHVQDRIGHKVALTITLWGWVLMVVLAVSSTRLPVFWAAATVAGLCMGTSQSAGRAMVGALAPAGRPAEFYALWAFATQLAAVVGPLCYGLVTWVSGGNHRLALGMTGLFFLAALGVLRHIDFARGTRLRDTM